MGIITKIEALPRMKKRLAVEVDGEKLGVIGAPLAREAGLAEGKEMTPARWERLMDEEIPRTLDIALYYLGLKARTRREMEAYLARRQYAPRVAAAVMEKLEEYGFVDDEELTHSAVETMSRRKLGRGAMERKLRLRGIDKEMAREALAEGYRREDEAENARALALSLWEKYRREEPLQRRKKTSAALARRGFAWDSIRDAMRGLDSGEEEEYFDN